MPDRAGRRRGPRLWIRRGLLTVLCVYGLLAAFALVAGLIGLFGPDGDPLAMAPLILLGMPWSLALALVSGDSIALSLAVVIGCVLVNLAVLLGLLRLIGKPRRRRTMV